MANPPTDLMTPPSDLVDAGSPPSDLMSPPSDLVKEEPSSKYSVKDILKRATALPEAVIKGIGKRTGQEVSLEPTASFNALHRYPEVTVMGLPTTFLTCSRS